MLQLKQHMHYPTLKTVLMVEDVLKNANLAISKNELLRRLPTKVDRQTLNTILAYMEDRGMILQLEKGVLWTYVKNEKLKKLRKSGIEV